MRRGAGLTLSIVVPVVDEAAGIVGALAPLQALRDRDVEIIVVDGGSADATPALAQPLADRVLASPRGRAVQMNVGASIARGEMLLFLHADCRLPPGALDAIVCTRAAWGRFDVRLDGRSPMLGVVAFLMNVRSRLSGIATGDQAMFVSRRAFDAVGGFPPLPLMEDVELSKRLKRTAGAPACLRELVRASGRRWDAHGAWRTIAAMWSLRFAYWRGTDASVLAQRYYGRESRPPTVLQLFAKPPLPGRVKTRLASTLGDRAATEIYAGLLRHTLDVAAAARRAGVVQYVEAWIAPGDPPGVLDEWCAMRDIPIRTQEGRDLGERMRFATRDAIGRGARVLLIGSDVPEYDVPYLAAAAAALERHDTVFGPAEDGGYVLVGLARDLDVFDGVPWSTPDVMRATRTRLSALQASSHELPTLFDIDTEADLARWQARRRDLVA